MCSGGFEGEPLSRAVGAGSDGVVMQETILDVLFLKRKGDLEEELPWAFLQTDIVLFLHLTNQSCSL